MLFTATRSAQIEDAVGAYRQNRNCKQEKTPIFADFKQSEWTKLEQAASEIQQEQSLKKEVAKKRPANDGGNSPRNNQRRHGFQKYSA